MTRVTITVPTHLNDGTAVPGDTLKQIGLDVVQIAGGYTLTEANGAWQSPDGKVYRDHSLVFTTDTGSDETVDGLRLLATWIAGELNQEAIYFTTTEVEVEYIAPVLA